MQPVRIFLGFSVAVWLPYAVFCFFQPSYLGEAAGLVATSATAASEVRAMYGGLQAAIGCFALAALFRSSLVRPALLMLAFMGSGLAIGRLGGVVLDGGVSVYTVGALGFEIGLSSLALYFLSRSAAQSPA